ncbi:MAG: adenosylcobinamide-GDP ribazoletransferase [Bacteroidota bacterium]
MKEELKVFFTAVMFYTRIPCPSWVDHSPAYINKSVRYFPLVGWIVGTLAGVGLVMGDAWISPLFAALLFVAISVWVTGAFHEDGFADVCDGFGGGWTQEQILNIMKDSRVGTYAVVGLTLLILIKVSLLVEIIPHFSSWMLLLIVINGHALSRFMAATVIYTHQYVREDEQSKAKPVAKSFTINNLLLAIVFGSLPLVALSVITHQLLWLFMLPVLYLVKVLLGRHFQRKIGGYTGDCLGATQQIVEVTYYLLVVLVWRFI